MLQLPFLADLEKAGFARDSIDRVLCTHLHVDHHELGIRFRRRVFRLLVGS
jgi:hypothetical protein